VSEKRSFDTNLVVLNGRVGFSEYKQVGAESRGLLRFSVATTTEKKADGSDLTNWTNCTVWGAYADSMKDTIQKGTRVAVVGRLVAKTYDDKSGAKQTSTEVVVTSVFAAQPVERLPAGSTDAPKDKSQPADDPIGW